MRRDTSRNSDQAAGRTPGAAKVYLKARKPRDFRSLRGFFSWPASNLVFEKGHNEWMEAYQPLPFVVTRFIKGYIFLQYTAGSRGAVGQGTVTCPGYVHLDYSNCSTPPSHSQGHVDTVRDGGPKEEPHTTVTKSLEWEDPAMKAKHGSDNLGADVPG